MTVICTRDLIIIELGFKRREVMSCSKLKTDEGKEKVSIKWNQGNIITFLDTYVNFELLWNIRHTDYANKAKRESAMMKLMVVLTDQGVPVPDIAFLRARIKAIKSTYKTELLKVCESKKSGKGTDDLYVPKLPWFSTADSFMRDVSVTRKSTSNLVSRFNSIELSMRAVIMNIIVYNMHKKHTFEFLYLIYLHIFNVI